MDNTNFDPRALDVVDHDGVMSFPTTKERNTAADLLEREQGVKVERYNNTVFRVPIE